jgi:hypothetical protein
MAAKLTRLTHKIVTQLRLVAAVRFAVLASGGQSGNVWIQLRSSTHSNTRHELGEILEPPNAGSEN